MMNIGTVDSFEFMNSDINEAADYFKSRMGFVRCFDEVRKKYASYGRLSGRVVIADPSDCEYDDIGGFLSKRFEPGKISFTIREFEAALLETKYASVSLFDLLEAYYGQKLCTRAEIDESMRDKKRIFRTELRNKLADICPDNVFLEWFDNRSPKEDEEADLVAVSKAVRTLSDRCAPVRLSVLSMECMGNPHGFDRKYRAARLLVSALHHITKVSGCEEPWIDKSPGSLSGEEIFELFISSGIRPDDISSYTVLYGIRLIGDDDITAAYDHLINSHTPYMVNLSNLGNVEVCVPKSDTVYIIENQGVFSEIVETCPESSCMCTSGQIKTASLLVMDMLLESGCRLCYCGDIDPEGIDIAMRLKQRSKGHVKLWHMDMADYEKSKSKKKITAASLHKLDRYMDSDMGDICERLLHDQLAGQQELLIGDMVEDILRGTKTEI